MKKNTTILLASILCVLIIVLLARIGSGSETKTRTASPAASIGIPEPTIDTTIHTIESGETLNGILQRVAGLTSEEAFNAVTQIQEEFDVTRIRADDDVSFVFMDGMFSQLSFDTSLDEMLIVDYKNGIASVTREDIVYEIREAQTEVTIESSLYLDGTNAGMTDRAILNLAQIFSWDVDFTTNIQKGDSFNVIYQNQYRDGDFVGVGDILAARFTNEGDDYYAFLSDGETKKYFDENGLAKERLLLKTPLNYSRVSSQFTPSRKHPILGTMRKHQGTDFAAPTGTPVESVGDGTVTFAGTNGGYGKFIKIQHGGGFETAYAHLSSISVKKGARVTQGQLIGKVGSTGASTGPHLHYEVIKNGTHVNPLRVDLPDGDPISDDLLMAFEETKQKYQSRVQ